MSSMAYVGMDVHKDTIRVAVLPETGTTFLEERTIPTDAAALRRVLRPWADAYTLQCFYEASSCGYSVHRWLALHDLACTVIAPSKTPRAPGERVKTDRRDARTLAIQGRAGTLAPVRVPTPDEEAVRGLVRQFDTQRQQLRAAQQRVQMWLLLRHQGYAAGDPWTQAHWRWLHALRFAGVDGEVFAEYLAEVQDWDARVTASTHRLTALASTAPYAAGVGRLGCFRGITPVRALIVLVETLDFARFPDAGSYMSYGGLVPREASSGGQRHQGAITKAGSRLLRYEFIEAAWQYQHPPRVGTGLAARQAGQPPAVVVVANQAQRRLHRQYWKLVHAKKPTGVAVVAVARELAGFVWAAMTRPE